MRSYTDVHPNDLERNLSPTDPQTLEEKIEQEQVKGGLGAFAAGALEFFGNWSTDFAMIGTNNGFVDVPIGISHTVVPVDYWMALSATSHLLALGAVAYGAFKLGNVVRIYRAVTRAKKRASKFWKTIAKFSVPLGLAAYLTFEGVVLVSYMQARNSVDIPNYDSGIWWNNAALAKIPSLVLASMGYYARGKLGRERHDFTDFARAKNYLMEKVYGLVR